MQEIMKTFRTEGLKGFDVVETQDYSKGFNGLPKADVLKYKLANGSIVVRPSGTEPKLKTYISIVAPTKEQAMVKEKEIAAKLSEFFK